MALDRQQSDWPRSKQLVSDVDEPKRSPCDLYLLSGLREVESGDVNLTPLQVSSRTREDPARCRRKNLLQEQGQYQSEVHGCISYPRVSYLSPLVQCLGNQSDSNHGRHGQCSMVERLDQVAQEGLSVDLDCGDRRRFEIGCSFARNGPESLVNRVEEFLPQDQRCVQILWGCIPQSVPPQKEASNEACLQAQIISTGRSAGVRRPAVTLEREGEGALIFHIGVSVRVASFLAQRPSLIHLQTQMTAR